MKNLSLYIFFVAVILLNSCSSTRKAVRESSSTSGPAADYVREYLSKYSDLAVSEMSRTGIPASITLAQGMLESNYGRSRLATQGNNHFGIKCHSDWTGQKIYHDDNHRNECFRSYRSAEESFRDHSDFLINGSRYRDLFSLEATDYKAWAHGLKRAGYATDPKYPDLLIRKIEDYGLWAYDAGGISPLASQAPAPASPAKVDPARTSGVTPARSAAGTGSAKTTTVAASSGTAAVSDQPSIKEADSSLVQPVPEKAVPEDEEPIKVISLSTGKKPLENNNVEYIIVEAGDTFESLADRYQLLSWEITRYNDLAAGASLVPGQVLYLQPKRTRAAQGLSVHVVAAGETMYSISQKYAIKLSSLYKLNLMDEGTECRQGQKLRLR